MDHNLNVHHPYFFSLFFFAGNGYLCYVSCLSLFSLSVGCLSRVVCVFVCISADYLVCWKRITGHFHKGESEKCRRIGTYVYQGCTTRVFLYVTLMFLIKIMLLWDATNRNFPTEIFFFHLVHKEKLLRLLEGGKQEIIIKTLISLKVFKMLSFCWCRWNF